MVYLFFVRPPAAARPWSYAETTVIVDLLPDGTVAKSARRDAVKPANAKISDVRRILKVAGDYAAELAQLWEKTHGSR